MCVLFATFRNILLVSLSSNVGKVPDPSAPLTEPHRSQYKACEDVDQNVLFAKVKRNPIIGPLWPRRFQEV